MIYFFLFYFLKFLLLLLLLLEKCLNYTPSCYYFQSGALIYINILFEVSVDFGKIIGNQHFENRHWLEMCHCVGIRKRQKRWKRKKSKAMKMCVRYAMALDNVGWLFESHLKGERVSEKFVYQWKCLVKTNKWSTDQGLSDSPYGIMLAFCSLKRNMHGLRFFFISLTAVNYSNCATKLKPVHTKNY